MTVEHDAVEIVGLALEPVRRGEQRGDRGHVRVVLGEPELHPQTVVVLDRQHLVGHPEPRVGTRPVVAVMLEQKPSQRVVLAQPDEGLEQVVAVDDGGHLTARHDGVGASSPHTVGDLGRRHLNGSVVRTFSCSLRMPCISISGLGGHPGTYTSTGTIVSTPCTIA